MDLAVQVYTGGAVALSGPCMDLAEQVYRGRVHA